MGMPRRPGKNLHNPLPVNSVYQPIRKTSRIQQRGRTGSGKRLNFGQAQGHNSKFECRKKVRSTRLHVGDDPAEAGNAKNGNGNPARMFFRKRTHIKRKEAIRVKWNEQAAPNNHQASADLLAAQSDETEFQYEELSDGGERNKVIQEQKKRRTHL